VPLQRLWICASAHFVDDLHALNPHSTNVAKLVGWVSCPVVLPITHAVAVHHGTADRMVGRRNAISSDIHKHYAAYTR